MPLIQYTYTCIHLTYLYIYKTNVLCAWATIRSAAEELVRSQFSAFKNMPSPGIQLERRTQNRLGGSTASLNKLGDPMSTSLTLSSRNASSISDLETAAAESKRPETQVHVPAPVAKPMAPAPPVDTDTPNRASKFTPSNIFKSFFK